MEQIKFSSELFSPGFFGALFNSVNSVRNIIFTVIVIISAVVAGEGAKEGKGKGILKILGSFIVLTSLNALYTIIETLINTAVFKTEYSASAAVLDGAFNPLSMIYVVLILVNYKSINKNAYLFGMYFCSLMLCDFSKPYIIQFVVFLSVRILIFILLMNYVTDALKSHTYFVASLYFLFTDILLYFRFDENGTTYEMFRARIAFIIAVTILMFVYHKFVGDLPEINFKKQRPLVTGVCIVLVLVVLPMNEFTVREMKYGYQRPEELIQPQEEEISEYTRAAHAEATSSLMSNSGEVYGPELTLDGEDSTCWQEGSDSDGTGEMLTYSFGAVNKVFGIKIRNGNLLNEEKYYNNCRAHNILITCYKNNEQVHQQNAELMDEYGATDIINLNQTVECDKITVDIVDVYSGSYYNDMCITDVQFGVTVKKNY